MKTFTKWLSEPSQFNYVNSAASSAERERRKAELKRRFDESNFAAFSSLPVETAPDSIYSAAEFAKIKEEIALSEIHKHAMKADVEPSLKRYIERRNSQILASKRVIAQRFGFTHHGTKTDN